MTTKSGGFFHLFDWNRKSRKKLFANGNGSPDGKKQVRRSDENLPSTRFHLPDDDDEDNDITMANIKESSDYSCASSVTDGEGNGSRAPGVVARLMGLDSLPTNGVAEPCSSPSFESRFSRENQYQTRGPDFEVGNQFVDGRSRSEIYTGKLPDWRFQIQKMPSSPIERFQREILPPRSAKSLPYNHYKLLSPIKNPKFVISSKDAAHIMETAAKILEPGFQTGYRGKVPQIDPSSLPLAFRDSKEYLATPQKHLDMSRAPRCLQGKPLGRSWNCSEGNASCRNSPGRDHANCTMARSKEKSVSLAIQAKVNVQKREGRSQPLPTEHDDFGWSRSCKNHQTSIVDHRPQKKNLPPNPSSILKQNNQKQNCLTNKDKLPAKRSLSHHHGKKVLSEASCSYEKNKSLNKTQGSSKGGSSREGLETNNMIKELQSTRTDSFPRKKRLIDGNQQLERRVYGNNSTLVGRNEKHVPPVNSIIDVNMEQVGNTKGDNRDIESFAFTSPPVRPKSGSRLSMKTQKNRNNENFHSDNKGRNIQANIIIDEKLKQAEDNRICGADVASFTFSSPLLKTGLGSGSSLKLGKKGAVINGYGNIMSGKEKHASGVENKQSSSSGTNTMGEDALGILLEQKLRGLAFESESYNAMPFKFSSLDSASTSRNSPCSEYALSEKMEQSKSWQSGAAKLSGIPDSQVYSCGGQALAIKNERQLADNFMECCSSSSTCEELEHYASPFSVLEANFSNDSCNSCESYDSYGIRTCSSVLAQNASSLNATFKISEVDAEQDLSDSASSSIKVTMNGDCGKKTHTRSKVQMQEQDMDYVKEILYTANVNPKYFLIGRTTEKLDPLLFNLLESKKCGSAKNTEACSLRRKLLFDCVRECLDFTQGQHFRAGYKAWARGMSVVRRENLPEEICGEISAWEGMGDEMVDELVDRDMNLQLGKRDNFENDSFGTGVEIEKKILASLIDEMVFELLA